MNHLKKFLPLFFISPAIVIYQLSAEIDWRIIIGYIVLISLLTYGFYWHDKRQAKRNGWRTPESTLHLLELLGGWPAAFLAQQKLRHKTQKKTFQAVYWLIVIVYQLAPVFYLWKR